MKRLIAAALAAAASAACAALPFAGYSIEAWGAATSLEPDTGAAGGSEGLGYTAGVTLALEVDYVRGSDLGVGLGYGHTEHPSGGSGTFVAHYWMASSSPFGTDDVRPRMHAGLLLGQDEPGMFQGYVGAGASLHPSRGRAWHVFAGPQFTAVSTADGLTMYTGWGGFVRVRYYRGFFRGCDVTPSEAREQYSDDAPRRPVECR